MGTTTTRRLCWLVSLIALAAFGCGDDNDTRCGEGTELVARECVPLLTDGGSQPPAQPARTMDAGGDDGGGGSTLECSQGTHEADGRCRGLGPIGAACESGADCATGSCLAEDRGATGGYCTLAGCNDTRPCPSGSHCYFSAKEETFLCLAYCDGDDGCRDDYACQPLYRTSINVCTPSCAVTDACPHATFCDEESGKCLLHECDPSDADACGADELLCYPDRAGLSAAGGLCLPKCDPSTEAETCATNEVCQPLPDDPVHSGICAPPVCSSSEECPAGAVCAEGVCQPPARCDDDGACEDEDRVCVGGAGGQCMPHCDSDDECTALHSGLSCSSTLQACLPTGTFPGGACRSDLNSPCSALTVAYDDGSATSTPMTCENGLCVASCAEGGSDLCAAIAPQLTCAEGILAQPSCLPAGSFPGGPCAQDGSCGAIAHGDASLPMACEDERCLVTCDDAAGGDVLCNAVDASLICVADLFGDDIDTCLPRGSVPGQACGAGDSCDEGMTCADGRCLYECATGGDTLCRGLSETLACARGVFASDVCLPAGSFPGGPCGAGDTCAADIGGLANADMFCAAGRCVVQCQDDGPFESGDALCATVNPTLTCLTSPGPDFCVTACGDGDACPTGSSCLASQDACLPTGTFLGSPCAANGTCTGAPMLVCVPGAMPRCAAGCTALSQPGASAYCQGVAAMTGTTFDTCINANPSPPPDLLICFDAP